MAPRRSPRLHPQIHPSQEGAGTARRRSPRLHPHIQASQEEGAGLARRRSPRRGPQVHSSEEGAGMARRAGTSPEAADASLPDDDDLLREILLRLPPQPSSLPRASAVCKRWRSLVTDPKFHRQFSAHHRKPPLLGIFSSGRFQRVMFIPVLDPPDCIPPQRFSLGLYSSMACEVLDCRHGLLLLKKGAEILVRDPITSEQHRVGAIPPELRTDHPLGGAVLCAADDQGTFKVVLVSVCKLYDTPLACVYTSESGMWSSVISTEARCKILGKPAVLVGNCLYWLSMDADMLQFDMGQDSLTVIRGPPSMHILFLRSQIIQAEHGVVGYAIFSHRLLEMWQRNINGHGVATWVLWKTIEMHTILPHPITHQGMCVELQGYDDDDDDDVVFLCYDTSVYMVQLKSMQSKKLNESRSPSSTYFPFKSFFTPGASIAGGFNGAEMLQWDDYLV